MHMSFSDNLIYKCCKYENIKKGATNYQWRTRDEHERYQNKIHHNGNVTDSLRKVVSAMAVIRWGGI